MDVIGFDGKIDVTLTIPGTVKEEHIVIVKFPGSHYVDYFSPDNVTASKIADEMQSWITETENFQL